MASLYTAEFQESLDYVLEIDPSLRPVVESSRFTAFLAPRPPAQSSFQYLVRSIVSQQVSGAAGTAIYKRFLALLGRKTDELPQPADVLRFSIDELKGAGLSTRKAEYITSLAEAYISGSLSDEVLTNADDDEVVDRIVAIRGLGPWTAQMFLLFYLHRSNVYSPGDVGVHRGYRRYIKERPHVLAELGDAPPPPSPGKSRKAQAKTILKPDLKDMERVFALFAPHRSAFQVILWKLADIKMDTVEATDEDAAKATNG